MPCIAQNYTVNIGIMYDCCNAQCNAMWAVVEQCQLVQLSPLLRRQCCMQALSRSTLKTHTWKLSRGCRISRLRLSGKCAPVLLPMLAITAKVLSTVFLFRIASAHGHGLRSACHPFAAALHMLLCIAAGWGFSSKHI